MRKIGFSTGSLSYGNFEAALEMLKGTSASAVELSALRENELSALMKAIKHLDLTQYEFISIHAPSKLEELSEEETIEILQPAIERGWHIIVHPDIIYKDGLWQKLGELLCIENMDKRKPIGRTANDMEKLFERFSEAKFCFDIAHAKQVDPTMFEAFKMLKMFRNRLVQIHMSEVNTSSKHERLNLNAILAYQLVSAYIPVNTPVILESPVISKEIHDEIQFAKMALSLKEMENYFEIHHLDNNSSKFIINQQKMQLASMN